MYVHVRVYVIVCKCIHAYLVMSLIVGLQQPLSQAIWQGPGKMRVPCIKLAIQQWNCTMHMYHTDTLHMMLLVPEPSLDSGP